MDKTKTLEVLRGMKFMQRKEEAKRRAMYEVDQNAAISATATARDEDGKAGQQVGSAGPTILHDTSFPASAYSYSRRSFYVHVEPNPKSEGTAVATGKSGAAKEADSAHDSEMDSDNMEGCWDEDDDPTSRHAPASTANPERFFVEAGIKAPKLPKRLRETVEAEEAEKKRCREEEEMIDRL